MCKYCGASKSKKTVAQQAQFTTFQAMFAVNGDEDLVTVAAKSSVNLDTPKGTQHLRAGAVTSLPAKMAQTLIEQGAPIWIT